MKDLKPIFLDADNVVLSDFDVKPLDDFTYKENYPNCCSFHASIHKAAKDWFAAFPDCCDTHRRFARRLPGFRKKDYERIVDKIVDQYAYTEHVIKTRIEASDWLYDITDYLTYNIKSFGHPRIGDEIYIKAVVGFIKDTDEIPPDKKSQLLEYFNPPTTRPKPINPASLYDIYHKWLKIFPFDLEPFRRLRQLFEKQLPLWAETPHVNRYSGMASAPMVTEDGLISALFERTKMLLQSVDTATLLQKGTITEPQKLQLELLNQKHRIDQSSLFTIFAKGEIRYVKVIKKWLENEKRYFREFTMYLQQVQKENEKVETISRTLEPELNACAFDKLPKTKALSSSQLRALFELLNRNELPYKIAMLDYVGFIEHIVSNYTKSKGAMHQLLAKILRVQPRAIKGNISVLNVKSTENRERYTAHLHKESVINDYEKLK